MKMFADTETDLEKERKEIEEQENETLKEIDSIHLEGEDDVDEDEDDFDDSDDDCDDTDGDDSSGLED